MELTEQFVSRQYNSVETINGTYHLTLEDSKIAHMHRLQIDLQIVRKFVRLISELIKSDSPVFTPS